MTLPRARLPRTPQDAAVLRAMADRVDDNIWAAVAFVAEAVAGLESEFSAERIVATMLHRGDRLFDDLPAPPPGIDVVAVRRAVRTICRFWPPGDWKSVGPDPLTSAYACALAAVHESYTLAAAMRSRAN